MEAEPLGDQVSLHHNEDHKFGNKRRKLDGERRYPLKEVDNNTRKYNFFESVSGDEDEDEDEPRLTHKSASTVGDTCPRNSETLTGSTTLCSSLYPYDKQIQSEGSQSAHTSQPLNSLLIQTFSGKSHFVGERRKAKLVPYEQIVASRSITEEGRAKTSYYGINVHELIEELSGQKAIADAQANSHIDSRSSPVASVEKPSQNNMIKRKPGLWCDRYRAHKFTDLVGDERTHRSVLHWLKRWDPIVFPSSRLKKKPTKPLRNGIDESVGHRKVLILAGPPGLGKTTLAHVCARQAGYEVHEINGSDERTGRVVKERISDMLGTENVRGISTKIADGVVRKAGKPQCVVVDEVDGVVSGSGKDEGGFIKALLELIQLDQRNTSGSSVSSGAKRGKKKFKMLRPLILVCNDIYHPSLRGLRQSSLVEIIHMRKPPINAVISRLCSIFEREGMPADMDGIRRLCEATWGISTKKDARGSSGTAVGDIRSVLVVGEWVASKFRQNTSSTDSSRLTKSWIEENILCELAYGGGAVRSLGRGSTKDIVERVFQEDAGFLKSDSSIDSKYISQRTGTVGVTEAAKRRAMNRLNEMVYTSGDTDRIVTDCFTSYPTYPIQDDSYLTKPNAAYEWLHFYDRLNTVLYSSQEWEIAPYQSSPVLAFHHLFSQSTASRAFSTLNDPKMLDTDAEISDSVPFSGPSAPYAATESLKANKASIQALHCTLSHSLARTYRSRIAIATELLPYVLCLLAPDVKPVVIHMSSSNNSNSPGPIATVRRAEEKERVARAVECMAATGVRFERSRVEGSDGSSGGYVYRMEPSLDALGAFEGFKTTGRSVEGVRFAVRQVLEGEWRRRITNNNRAPSYVHSAKEKSDVDKKQEAAAKGKEVKRDFFGRIVLEAPKTNVDMTQTSSKNLENNSPMGRVWVSYHEGFSNAVRRPITIEELLRGL